jgi:hypothetical protein
MVVIRKLLAWLRRLRRAGAAAAQPDDDASIYPLF